MRSWKRSRNGRTVRWRPAASTGHWASEGCRTPGPSLQATVLQEGLEMERFDLGIPCSAGRAEVMARGRHCSLRRRFGRPYFDEKRGVGKAGMLRERDRSLSLRRSRRLSQLSPPPRVQASRCATGCRTGVSVTCSAARRPRRWVGWTTAQPSCSICCARKSSFGRATCRKTTSRRRVARCIRFLFSVQK